MKTLKPKVTAASVKREWENKYAELNEKYESLCNAHRTLAYAADCHRNTEEKLRQMATDRLVRIHQLEGVIIYLEGKLNGTNN